MASLEREIHRWLHTQVEVSLRPEVMIGIGDDGAVLHPSDQKLVVTTDTIAEGTHFLTNEHSLELIGRKSLAVNFSDVAAMGGTPFAAVLHWILPRSITLANAKLLFDGLHELAKEHNVAIIGGDTNVWAGPLVIGATVFGSLEKEQSPWRLNTASPGDAIFVSGEFGGSILGGHLRFEPAVELASELASLGIVSAATDVSDSLSRDLQVMATASGCGAEIMLDRIPISNTAFELARKKIVESGTNMSDQHVAEQALRHAMSDGEDFGLILAIPSLKVDLLQQHPELRTKLTKIGQFCEQGGLWARGVEGRIEPITPEGYDH